MRFTFSNHTELIDSRASDIWPSFVNRSFRPLLNIQALWKLLQLATDDDHSDSLSPSSAKGRKRSFEPPVLGMRSFKHPKVDAVSDEIPDGSETSTELRYVDNYVWPIMDYPSVAPSAKSTFLRANESVPILQHVFEIQYTKGHGAGSAVDSDEIPPGWDMEEKNLSEIMNTLRSHQQPRVIDLGEADFVLFHGRLVVVSTALNPPSWSFVLPETDKGIDLAWFNISERVKDLMMACYILKSVGRVTIHARLKMIILTQNVPSATLSNFPFRLQIVADIAFRIPSVFESIPRGDKNSLEVEEAQRWLCEYLYPSDAVIPKSFDGTINIPFFYSILPPAPPAPLASLQNAIQPADLRPTLLPFQCRSVAWLLDREGKVITSNGKVIPKPISPSFSFWNRIEEGNYTWYLNRLSGLLSPSLPSSPPVLGGILAEEPGLGKTLEIIALILMNPAPPERSSAPKCWDAEAQLEVKATKATLIVTPPALASQWADELEAHAPSLKVLVYDGWSKVSVPITTSQITEARRKIRRTGSKHSQRDYKANNTMKLDEDYMDQDYMDQDDSDHGDDVQVQDWCSYVNTFDVVIVTYAVLRSDFNIALAAPVRPRRVGVAYSNFERPRSPLVMCEWYRVVMDEVQMVGGGKTEDMVSLIPRLSSFAVSGTPARAQVSDLIHVLKFLRADGLVGSPKLWNRLITSGFASAHFAALFQSYAIRTLKSNVKDELTIPQQMRYLVSISLGPVEKHVYDQTLETALLDLGLDARGVTHSQGWQLDSLLLRSSLRKLRGICTHPQVGQLQRQGEKGLYKGGAVKTIDDVLQNMKDLNWRAMMDHQKSKVQMCIRIAQLQLHGEDPDRFQHSLLTLLDAEREALAFTKDVSAALDKFPETSNFSKAETSAKEPLDKGKGKNRQQSDPLSEQVDSSDESFVRSPATEEYRKKRGALQNRLRECRLTLHRVKFFQGDAYHSLGPTHSASEDAAYGAAEEIRHELLRGSEDDAIRSMAALEHDAIRKRLTRDALLIDIPFLGNDDFASLVVEYQPTKEELHVKPQLHKVGLYQRAKRSLELIAEANGIMGAVLNKQSMLLWEWRTHMVSLLTKKLSQGKESADGEEYQRTLENQGEAETYIQCYADLLSDRRQAILNERTLLAAHAIREKKFRQTKAATNAANVDEEISGYVELQAEHQVLFAELSLKRKTLSRALEGRAIKSVLIDLNAAYTRINKAQDPEKLMLKEVITELRQFITEQGALMDKLEADLTLIRKVFNQRILYFRQLQEISDSVAEVVWEGTVLDALQQSILDKNELEGNINRNRARLRYLDNITGSKNEGVRDEDDEWCILCRCEFARGFITDCAHMFCEGCMKAWLFRKEGKTCPVCRIPIHPGTIQRFAVNEPQPPPRIVNAEPVPKSRRKITYNMINPQVLEEIRAMDSFGDFGSKIQTLIQHLLYLKAADPGAKSIVFSAWADSLHIMERAMRDNGIRCLRIDQKSKGENATKTFKNNPDILVLLLHGERENAGLNITCASRVFLLESVVHHGFELQAIARIDRMGQSRPTEVYCYYAEDTVERNILDLAARKGLSLYTKGNSAGTLNVSSLGVDVEVKIDSSPKKKIQKKGDFIFKLDDMLAILFPHMFEEIEFLLPSVGVDMHDDPESAPLESDLGSGDSYREIVNAIAGPSKLPLN